MLVLSRREREKLILETALLDLQTQIASRSAWMSTRNA